MKTKTLTLLGSLILFLAAIIVIVSGCKKDDKTETAEFRISLESTGALRAVYNEVNIDVQQLSIHTSTNPDETGGWFNLPTTAGIYDLLDYDAGNDTIIALEPFLEVQTVSQIRILLGNQNTIVVDGVTYDLETPSGQTSGLKVQIHAVLQPNFVYKVVLDFDVDKSIVKTGNDKYKLTPVINATVVQL